KQKPDPIIKSPSVPIYHQLKINKEMYNILNNFRQISNIENEKYLFSIKWYSKFLITGEISNRKHYITHISWQQMTNLLDQFHDEVISSQYGIKVVQTRDELDSENDLKTIKRFNLGDTRHLSICMMMMQGFSELTIAQMAGHTDIRTQSHYSCHIGDFQRSYSGLLAKSILKKMNIGDNSGFDSFTFRQKQLLSYSNRDSSKARKINFGYCHSDNFPNECFSKDCVFCNKFQIELSKLSAEEFKGLKMKISKLQDEIQVKLNFIKKYYSTAYKKKNDTIDTNISDLKELEKNAANLNILMNREAMIKAHLTKNKEI
ncbi:hypothetical protein, partial [Mesobacillus zeae]|uniref:hypothetical protein n=1 Tax=Mesobacillus zeae TaxID=1917180 RepID=UPI00300A4943